MAPDSAQTRVFLVCGAVVDWFQGKNVAKMHYFAPAGSLRQKSVMFSAHLNSENLKLILNYYATELNFDFQIEEFFPKGDLHLIHDSEWGVFNPNQRYLRSLFRRYRGNFCTCAK